MDPEGVLLHSGIEAASAAGFLHENLLHFISEDAIEDAATACQCLSDTGEPHMCHGCHVGRSCCWIRRWVRAMRC